MSLWSYVFPLPVSKDRVKVIETLFKPKAGLKILRRIDPEGRVYQGDLVRTLGLSNKTVISQLRKMVDLGILKEHREKIVRRESTFWAKSYELTEAGRWIYYFVVEERRLSKKRMRRLAEQLLQLYATGSMSLCRSFGLSPEAIHGNLDLAWMKQALVAEERKRASVVVFGTAAVDLVLHLSGKAGFERSYVSDAVQRPGGAGANVAVGLSKLGTRTALAAKVGADANGRLSIEDLLREEVVCRNLVVSEKHATPVSVVALSGTEGKHVFYVDGADAALSIEPGEVDWDLLRRARAAVLCECFIEVCRAVVDRATERGISVFYRPSFPYVLSVPDDVAEVAQLCDAVILGSEEADLLSRRGYGLSSLSRRLVLTRGPKGCTVFDEGTRTDLRSKTQRVREDICARDAFTAALVASLLQGCELEAAARRGMWAAATTLRRGGCRQAMPKASDLARLTRDF